MRAELKDSLEFLYADSTVSAAGPSPLLIDVARGGTLAVHVLLNDLKPGETLDAKILSAGKPVRGAQWFRLIAVPVEENTGLRNFTESTGGPNEFVARRAPFQVFDAMQPVKPPLKVENATAALRLHIPVAAAEKPGQRQYQIELRSGADAVSLPFEATVHKAVIPPVGKNSWPYTNWFSYELVASRHQIEPWSEAHWKMLRKYAESMAAARQNTFWIPLQVVFSRTDKGLVLNRPRLRRIVKVFTDAGLHFIEGGHFAGRTGGEWNAKTFCVVLKGAVTSSVEGNSEIASLARQLVSEIDANRWRARWIQHATDEPTKELASEYRILVGTLRKYMPGIPILDATMDTGLAGAPDFWCPQCQEYQHHRDGFEALRKLGDKVWFYTCCSPGGPWLNRLLDQELLRPALFGWAGALFQLDGFLHWGFNHYRDEQDPFKMSVVGHGGNNKLPAGDTHIVYPGAGGPWSSVRMEAQREGTEDFELLRQLRERNPKKADEVVRLAIRGFDDYTKDAKVFRQARRALLETAGKK